MAFERVTTYRNAGTNDNPLWEQYFNKTVADAVAMGESDPTTIKEYVDQKIADLIGGSPESADTLKELYDIITANKDLQDALDAAIGGKADKDHVHDVANTQKNGFMSTDHVNKLNAIAPEATKTEKSDTNGNIKINGTENTVYTHPDTHPASMITQSDNYKFVTKDQISRYDRNTLYNNATAVPVQIGGIDAGTKFTNDEVNTILDRLLYPFTPPEITATTDPAPGFYEKQQIQINTITVTVSEPKNANNEILKIAVHESHTDFDVGEAIGDITKGGTFEIKPNLLRLYEDSRLTVRVEMNNNGEIKIVYKDIDPIVFVDPIYTGVLAYDADVNTANVTALTKKLEPKENKIYKYTCNNQKIAIAYPSSYGDLSSIIDKNGFNIINSFTKSTLNLEVTGVSTAVAYNVYANNATTVTDYEIKFNF